MDKASKHSLKTIRVDYFDEDAKYKSFIFDDYTATIIQHEVDHLNGILLSDPGK